MKSPRESKATEDLLLAALLCAFLLSLLFLGACAPSVEAGAMCHAPQCPVCPVCATLPRPTATGMVFTEEFLDAARLVCQENHGIVAGITCSVYANKCTIYCSNSGQKL